MVAAATFLAYWTVLLCDFTNFDDPEHVIANPLVRQPSLNSLTRFFTEVRQPSTVSGYYKPLTMASLMVDSWLSGTGRLKPWIFHLTNLLLHVGSAVLVVLIIATATGSWQAGAILGLLFALHPLNVEAVAWISQRKGMLAAFFSLLAILAHLRRVRPGRRRFWFALELIALLLALLAKPTAVPLPLMLLAIDYWPLKRLDRRALAQMVPALLLAAGFAVVTLVSHGQSSGQSYVKPDLTAAGLLLVPAHNIAFYLYKILVPLGLYPIYPYPQPVAATNPPYLAGLVVTALVIALVIWSWRRSRPLAAGLAFFLLALAPVLGTVPFTHSIAGDRFAYLPMVGLLLAAAAGLAPVLAQPRRMLLVFIACFAVAGIFGLKTKLQCRVWLNSVTLWQHALAGFPDSAFAHATMGDALVRTNRLEEALSHLRRAVELDPQSALARYNLAVALGQAGHAHQAIGQYEAVLKLVGDHAGAHCNLAPLLAGQGETDQALWHLDQAISAAPSLVHAYFNKALIQRRLGQPELAVDNLERAILLAPHWHGAHHNLAIVLTDLGRIDQAIHHYRLAIAARADYLPARFNLALLFADRGQLDLATRQLHQILSRHPEHPRARQLLQLIQQDQPER